MQTPHSSHRSHQREAGAALLVAVLMLALMGLIGFASMDTVMRDRQVAGNTSLNQSALYAADAAIANALEVLRKAETPPALTANDCIADNVPVTSLPNGSSYRQEAGTQICMRASAGDCLPDTSQDLGVKYVLWNVEVEGQAPGGATARVEAIIRRCHAFSSH